MTADTFPTQTCECGALATWHGDLSRTFCCDACWARMGGLDSQDDAGTRETGAPDRPLALSTPTLGPGWFAPRLEFLGDTDRETLHMVLQRAFGALNLRVTLVDGETFDAVYRGAYRASTDPEAVDYTFLRFALLADDGDPTLQVRDELTDRIAAVGIY